MRSAMAGGSMSGICPSRSPTISSSSEPASAGSPPPGSTGSGTPDASILILDNHDDFGGHAKRNEFTVDGRFLLGYGGSEAMQSPEALYGPAAKGLAARRSASTTTGSSGTSTPTSTRRSGCRAAVFFTREAFGDDRLVTGDPMRMVADDIPADRMNERSPEAFIADFPVSAEARAQLVELYTSNRDPFPALDAATKRRRPVAHQLSRLRAERHGGSDDEAADTFQGRPHDFFAIGIDGVSAIDAMETGYPGFAGLAPARRVRGPRPRWTSRTSTTSPTGTRRSHG